MDRGVNRQSTVAEMILDKGTQEEGTIATTAPRQDSTPHAPATATADRTPEIAPGHRTADASNRETATQATHHRATIASAATAATTHTTGEAEKAATTADATGATADTPLPSPGDAAQTRTSHSKMPRKRTCTRTKIADIISKNRNGKNPLCFPIRKMYARIKVA